MSLYTIVNSTNKLEAFMPEPTNPSVPFHRFNNGPTTLHVRQTPLPQINKIVAPSLYWNKMCLQKWYTKQL